MYIETKAIQSKDKYVPVTKGDLFASSRKSFIDLIKVIATPVSLQK